MENSRHDDGQYRQARTHTPVELIPSGKKSSSSSRLVIYIFFEYYSQRIAPTVHQYNVLNIYIYFVQNPDSGGNAKCAHEARTHTHVRCMRNGSVAAGCAYSCVFVCVRHCVCRGWLTKSNILICFVGLGVREPSMSGKDFDGNRSISVVWWFSFGASTKFHSFSSRSTAEVHVARTISSWRKSELYGRATEWWVEALDTSNEHTSTNWLFFSFFFAFCSFHVVFVSILLSFPDAAFRLNYFLILQFELERGGHDWLDLRWVYMMVHIQNFPSVSDPNWGVHSNRFDVCNSFNIASLPYRYADAMRIELGCTKCDELKWNIFFISFIIIANVLLRSFFSFSFAAQIYNLLIEIFRTNRKQSARRVYVLAECRTVEC